MECILLCIKFSNSAYKTPPLVHYRRCASIGKCRSVRETCPLSGIRSCPLFGSCKCIASTGIAVGTATVVRYSGDVRYWECPLSEVPLYIANHNLKLLNASFLCCDASCPYILNGQSIFKQNTSNQANLMHFSSKGLSAGW